MYLRIHFKVTKMKHLLDVITNNIFVKNNYISGNKKTARVASFHIFANLFDVQLKDWACGSAFGVDCPPHARPHGNIWRVSHDVESETTLAMFSHLPRCTSDLSHTVAGPHGTWNNTHWPLGK